MFCFWSLRYYFTKEWDVRPENAISPKTWCNASSIVYPCCSVGRMSYVHWFQSTCLTCPSIHESFHNLALVFCWPYQKRKKKEEGVLNDWFLFAVLLFGSDEVGFVLCKWLGARPLPEEDWKSGTVFTAFLFVMERARLTWLAYASRCLPYKW